ncbi:MAG: hypothetical protein EA381_02745 [Planctomycetaceae bacterium]|nr:MAG: hypothetical protein EA381_02745 [Planctomycetaceae bacterium]
MTVDRLRRVMLILMATCWVGRSARAQLTTPIGQGVGGNQVATLDQQLINRLRATTEDRQAYIRLVVRKTETGELDRARVLAMERFAIKQNPRFPFPFFERAMKFESERVGVFLPPVRLLARPNDGR